MNEREWFVDTGYWFAIVNTRDSLHREAMRLTVGLQRRLVTTEAVLVEVGNMLATPPSRALAVSFLTRLRANPNVEIVAVGADLFSRAFAFYAARPDKEWGLTDCVSFVVMEEHGIREALAADQHFVQAGFRALLRE